MMTTTHPTQDPLIVRFKLLYPDAMPPVRATSGDAGWDLAQHRCDWLPDSGVAMLMTGVAVEIPSGYFGLLRPRSSICKTGYLFCSSGVIDSGYRGEIGVPMKWLQPFSYPEKSHLTYIVGDRIAQLVILPLPDVTFVQVDKLAESVRGEGGFGSSGS